MEMLGLPPLLPEPIVKIKNMSLTPILTSIALGFGVVTGYLTTELMYKAMYKGNRDGIACMDCNSYGEGNIEIIIGVIVLLISIYAFFNSLNKLV